MGIEDGIGLLMDSVFETSFMGYLILAQIAILFFCLVVMTRNMQSWKRMAFPLMIAFNVAGIKISIVYTFIAAFVFVVDTLSIRINEGGLTVAGKSMDQLGLTRIGVRQKRLKRDKKVWESFSGRTTLAKDRATVLGGLKPKEFTKMFPDLTKEEEIQMEKEIISQRKKDKLKKKKENQYLVTPKELSITKVINSILDRQLRLGENFNTVNQKANELGQIQSIIDKDERYKQLKRFLEKISKNKAEERKDLLPTG